MGRPQQDLAHPRVWKTFPYVKPWKAVLTKRSLATVLYLIFSFAAAGIVVLTGKIG